MKMTANTHEYCEKSLWHKWQIHIKMIAITHELTFDYSTIDQNIVAGCWEVNSRLMILHKKVASLFFTVYFQIPDLICAFNMWLPSLALVACSNQPRMHTYLPLTTVIYSNLLYHWRKFSWPSLCSTFISEPAICGFRFWHTTCNRSL